MSVKDYGCLVEKAEHTIFLLPTETEQTIIGRTKYNGRNCVAIHCILPPSKKKLSPNPAIDSPAVEITTPVLLWSQYIFDEVYKNLGQWVKDGREVVFTVHSLDIQKLQRKAYMLGNVNSAGGICWGFGYQPANMRQAHLQFFNRAFNGAYSPGTYHLCARFCNPRNPTEPKCNQGKDCQCCKGFCRCSFSKERYIKFLKEYTHDNLPFPEEKVDFDSLEKQILGRKQKAFYTHGADIIDEWGWAEEKEEGWKIRVPKHKPQILKPDQVYIANINLRKGYFH